MSVRSDAAASGISAERVFAEPEAAYQGRLQEVSGSIERLEQRDRKFLRVRSILGVVSIGLGVLCIGRSDVVSWHWMLLPLTVFLIVLPFDRSCLSRLSRLRQVRAFHESRLRRLKRDFSGESEFGSEYDDESHPWIRDLDVFGRGSLFQLLNECRTRPGQKVLASWMTTVPAATEIRVRQARAQGLKQALRLREALACIPEARGWESAERLLKSWVREPAEPISLGVILWALLIGVASVAVLGLTVWDPMLFRWLPVLAMLQLPAIIMTRRQIQRTTGIMDDVDTALRQFSQVIAAFESHPVEEPAVRDLLNRFHTEDGTASVAIRRLSRLTAWLNNATRNQFFAPIAWFCGLFVLLTHRIECWRRRYGVEVADWLETVACLEATISVAGYCFDHPRDCIPEILEERAELNAEDLGHPLLPESVCVRNSVQLTPESPLMLISGSNMSGKSTFLRSIGTSIVLSFCGSVVRATRFQTHPFQLATAMRVSDSLQEGRSLFFSVVQRLKSVVDLTTGARTVLFLLDEILHGTNSNDRRRGAEAVIRSLVDRRAVGIVTTHDLALTRIADSMPGLAVNKHFEDTVVEGTMLFDYRLRDGVVERSNAIELMRMLGLDV
jgi:hypothetical protein